MKEQWRQQMRQKMADYKEPAPEVSWDEIEKAVAANGQQTKTIAMWPRRIAAAVVVLVTAGAGYYFLNCQQPEIAEETAETLLVEGTIKPEPVDPQPQETSDLPLLAQAKRQILQTIDKKKTEGLSVLQVAEDTVEQLAQTAEEKSEILETKPQQPETQQKEQAQQPLRKNSLPEAQSPVYPSALKHSASSGKRLMAKVYLSNAMSSGSNVSNDWSYKQAVVSQNGSLEGQLHYELDLLGNVPIAPSSSYATSDGRYNGVWDYMYYESVPVDEDVHHHQPIHLGLLLRYALNDRWGIESGLSYALLTSDITLSSTYFKAEAEQRLSYIGIPVNVSYQIWGSRHFNVYATVGGMAEKMVKGKQHQVVTYPTKAETDESVSIRPLQFSVSGGIGAEFQFIDWLSIYAEPGVGYWFDNGSSIPTYYQEKPFSFNLNVGLRFNIK